MDVDYKIGYARTELKCNTCGSHLGHSFDDGPKTTGKRHCINGVALEFIPIEETMVNVGGYFGMNRKEAEKRTNTLFNQLGIWDKRKNTPRELSGGMKRRLGIAQAIIGEPKVIVVDEPTTNTPPSFSGISLDIVLVFFD